jgi:DNA topoisomerase-1
MSRTMSTVVKKKLSSILQRSSRSKAPAESRKHDPVSDAQAAKLRYVSDESPGIRRHRAGKGFRYAGPGGKAVTDPQTLDRIGSLVIPPAWEDVWISSCPEGHLQATGRDARGRKQYRYHPRWREIRDETKYGRMAAFGTALARIHRHIRGDLRQSAMPRTKVLATIVRLLETTLIRVGNEEYARSNGSFGLTTMKDRHAEIDGAQIRFHFRGKSGKVHTVTIRNKRLARLVRRCQDLPGHELFHYVDESGNVQTVGSADVNDYLRSITGQDFTAKDFRTWSGSLLAADALVRAGVPASARGGRKQIVAAVQAVAERLGNTVSVCRKCYIHPAVLESFADGSLARELERASHIRGIRGLRSGEAALIALLRARSVRSKNVVRTARFVWKPKKRNANSHSPGSERDPERPACRTTPPSSRSTAKRRSRPFRKKN